MMIWSQPFTTFVEAVVGVLVVARLGRLFPVLRPLVAPFAFSALATAAFSIASDADPRLATARWPIIGLLVPLLILVVRAAVIAFEVLFRRSQGEPPPALLGSVVTVLLYGLGTGVIAHTWYGFELTPFLATSAVVGAVVGLALQETLGNLFAGIALHTEAPFQVGDWIRLGDREGRLEQVSWRAMRVVTWDGDTLTVPNNEAARHPILNFSLPRAPHSRVVIVGVSFHTPPNKVISVLRNLLEQVNEVSREPEPLIRIVSFHESSIHYEVRYHVPSYELYRAAEGEIFRLIWYHFRRHGIEIPFPTRTVHLHQPETREGRDSATSRLERALRGVDLFRPLTDEDLAMATEHFRSLHYSAGERIVQEGAPGDSFFVIDRGEVVVSKSIAGVERPLARLMEGQFFGEMALLTGERRAATVVAATDVDLFTIAKAGFEKILVANPAITVEISAILAERREALSQAEENVTARFQTGSPSELKQRILDRIRNYFGL